MSIFGNLVWITTLSFMIYTPILCYLDWKYRDIKSHKIWIPLAAINLPIWYYGFMFGAYPEILLWISIISIVVWGALMSKGIIPGGDAWFLFWISLFMVLNPISGQPFMITFLFYLVGFTAASYFYVFLDNLLIKREASFNMERGLPFLIPISCALITAVVMG